MWLYRITSSLKSRGLGYYSLHVGHSGFPPSFELMEKFINILKSRISDLALYSYTSPWGLIELREVIVSDLVGFGRVKSDPSTEVIITSDGIEDIFPS